MLFSKRAENTQTIERVVDLARNDFQGEHLSQTSEFIRQYYNQVDEEDLAERKTSALYGAAIGHLDFLLDFTSGLPKLRIYNPQLARDCWESPYTVLLIVNDDMPFLVDSVTMEANRQGFTAHLTVHPVLRTKRDSSGRLIDILPTNVREACGLESLIRMEIDKKTAPEKIAELEQGILRVLADVRRAVQDHAEMKARMAELAAARKNPLSPEILDNETIDEANSYLKWLLDRNFIFLGYRNYDLIEVAGDLVLRTVDGSGLGILRDIKADQVSKSFALAAPVVSQPARAVELLVLTKANSRSTIHRAGYLDYIGIKQINKSGKVIGEHRFLGLYTSNAYRTRVTDIPLLSRKFRNVLKRSGFNPQGHMGKALAAVLEEHPRDELLQRTEDELLDDTREIVSLSYRQRPRIFVRDDPYGRFVSCLVYLPRESYGVKLRERVQEILIQYFSEVSSEFHLHLSESALVRLHIIVRLSAGYVPQADVRELEDKISKAARRWEDKLHQGLVTNFGEERGNDFYRAYEGVFPDNYQDSCTIAEAVSDLVILDDLDPTAPLALRLYERNESDPQTLRLRAFHLDEPMPLSSSLPLLEHMGVKVLEELKYRLYRPNNADVYIHDFGLRYLFDEKLHLAAVKERFEEAFARVWAGEYEDDDFNRLVLRAGLDCRQANVLRAYSKYLRQAGFPFSQAYMEQALCGNPTVTNSLLQLFLARFDPGKTDDASAASLVSVSEITEALDSVQSLDEDRILRRFLSLILATTRTNYFKKICADSPNPYLSLKFDSALIPDLPLPKPKFEIFLYSPRVEGVHLRGGRVARGGLRWSDRLEDFRTEVLGLMKAQTVKNAVIVPVGSKGGFVSKKASSDRETLLNEGRECYEIFLRGLLDLTDNLKGGTIVPPEGVVRLDGDDPYLVVAADKGTATFSDLANGISAEYGFWLGDAFASGGSVGYDHKKMGITARGAWESVKRHFHGLGIDTQKTKFSVVGIGDMSGDVFGNGMLLSQNILLVAAFDHRHIFLDPNPDALISFEERSRLLNLPGSSWADYNPQLISKGGGVFPRTAKSILLTSEVATLLGVDTRPLAPSELIRAILKAQVDLLYNGGIGTYVKASQESNDQVSDHSNDSIRINGHELRCKVVVEGGNLGLTQRARIEFASAGGRINTDAIDNSAGVDCSDHEVNIKILLDSAVTNGRIKCEQRNQLLRRMTSEVASMVLRDNYFQAQTLVVRKDVELDVQERFCKHLEKAGRLTRELEFLPSDEEFESRKRAGLGLTSPERAVLLAYSKISLYEELLSCSDLKDDPYLSSTIASYFPSVLREDFNNEMQTHPLRWEIIATGLVNEIVNQVGSTFVYRMQRRLEP